MPPSILGQQQVFTNHYNKYTTTTKPRSRSHSISESALKKDSKDNTPATSANVANPANIANVANLSSTTAITPESLDQAFKANITDTAAHLNTTSTSTSTTTVAPTTVLHTSLPQYTHITSSDEDIRLAVYHSLDYLITLTKHHGIDVILNTTDMLPILLRHFKTSYQYCYQPINRVIIMTQPYPYIVKLHMKLKLLCDLLISIPVTHTDYISIILELVYVFTIPYMTIEFTYIQVYIQNIIIQQPLSFIHTLYQRVLYTLLQGEPEEPSLTQFSVSGPINNRLYNYQKSLINQHREWKNKLYHIILLPISIHILTYHKETKEAFHTRILTFYDNNTITLLHRELYKSSDIQSILYDSKLTTTYIMTYINDSIHPDLSLPKPLNGSVPVTETLASGMYTFIYICVIHVYKYMDIIYTVVSVNMPTIVVTIFV